MPCRYQEAKIYGLIREGEVATVLVSDAMRVRVCDLEEYLQRKKTPKN